MAKKTGATKQSTRRAVAAMEKKSRNEKKGAWKEVARLLERPRRKRAEVSLKRISALAQKNQGKTMIVPGKVLGNTCTAKDLSIIALEYSKQAQKAIEESGGKAMRITGPEAQKTLARDTVIVE